MQGEWNQPFEVSLFSEYTCYKFCTQAKYDVRLSKQLETCGIDSSTITKIIFLFLGYKFCKQDTLLYLKAWFDWNARSCAQFEERSRAASKNGFLLPPICGSSSSLTLSSSSKHIEVLWMRNRHNLHSKDTIRCVYNLLFDKILSRIARKIKK